VRRIAIVALARKLIVALWHFLEAGVILASPVDEGPKQGALVEMRENSFPLGFVKRWEFVLRHLA
jgi:hypothetical protein